MTFQILKDFEDNDKINSKHEKVVEKGLKIAENLQQAWILSSIENKVKLQNLVFRSELHIVKKTTQFELKE